MAIGENVKNCAAKIEATVEKFSEQECIDKMVGMFEVLGKRRSLLNLIFLKYCCIKVGREKSLDVFQDKNGFKILERTFTSTNEDFLDVLIDIFLYLKANRPVCINALDNFKLINKDKFFEYLNCSVGLYALLENYDENSTYFDEILKYVLSLEKIKDELNFLFKLAYDAHFNEIDVDITAYKNKFANVAMYEKLEKLLAKPEKSEHKESEKISEGKKLYEEEVKEIMSNSSLQSSLSSKSGKTQPSSVTKTINSNVTLKSEVKEDVFKIKYEEMAKKYEELTKKFNDLSIKNKELAEKASVVPEVKQDIKGVVEKNADDTVKNIDKENVAVKQEIKEEVKQETKPAATPVTPAKPAAPKRKIMFKSKVAAEEPAANTTAPGGKKKLLFKKAEATSKLETKKKYIGIKWSKIPKGKKTIFAALNVPELEKKFKLDEFDCFEKQEKDITPVNKPKPVVQKGPVMANILDGKKSMSLSIALGRIKMSDDELYNQIMTMKYTNETVIKQLILYMASPEEYELLKEANKKLLNRAELFFTAVKDYIEFENALVSIRFLNLYQAKDFKTVIEQVVKVYKEILDSKKLQELFGMLLILGNQLNRNVFGGKAEGFSFESCDKFKTKQIKDFLVKKVDFGEIKAELGKLAISENVDATIHEFQEVRGAYKKKVVNDEEFSSLCKLFDELLALRKDLMLYFNIESDERLPEKLANFIKYFM